jgi:hypothetical protein
MARAMKMKVKMELPKEKKKTGLKVVKNLKKMVVLTGVRLLKSMTTSIRYHNLEKFKSLKVLEARKSL